jgi:arylsulfatase
VKTLFFLSLLLAIVPCRAALPQKPNILFILTDDTGYGDLSAHGHPLLRTPNLDRLRSQSVRFTDFHVSPTCSPTTCSASTSTISSTTSSCYY